MQSGNQQGLTLVNAMIGLTLVSILAVLSFPTFSDIRHNSRMQSSLRHLFHSVHLARQISHIKGIDVVICGATHSLCHHGSDWSAGWIMFENAAPENPPQIGAGDNLLAVHEPDNSPKVLSNRPAFTFRPHGQRSTNGTLAICDRRGPAQARSVIVSYTGKPRLIKEERLSCSTR